MKLFLIPFFCFLTSCASQDQTFVPQRVEVPVRVPCVSSDHILHPSWPLDSITNKNTLFEKVRAALAEIELRAAYEAQLEAAVKGCE
jgi:hypothetical protein